MEQLGINIFGALTFIEVKTRDLVFWFFPPNPNDFGNFML